jgi:hypothetical protein
MARRPELVVDGQTNADAAYMNTILEAIGDLLKLKKELGDGSTESVIDVLNKFANQGFSNLLLNSDFSLWTGTTLNNWTAFASSVSKVDTTTDNSLGHDFAKITTDGSGNNAGIKQTTAENSVLSLLLPRVKSQQKTLSVKAKVRSSVPVTVALNDSTAQTAGDGTWEEVIVKRTFTGTESDISVQIYIPGTANTAATDFEVGEIVLVEGDTIPLSLTSEQDNIFSKKLESIYPRFPQFKNRIINGDFQIWQRGTTFTFGASQFGYTADRVLSSNGSDGQFTVSKSVLNNKPAFRVTVDTPPTDLTLSNYWNFIEYRFEGQHLYDLASQGKDITISFWFNSNVTGEYAVALRNTTDITVNQQSYVTSFTYTTANIPQKVEITVPLNASWNPAIQNDHNRGFTLNIAFLNQGDMITTSKDTWVDGKYGTTSTAVNWASTAGNFIEIAELQLEEGSVATDFEYVPYDIQLYRCQRYYEKNANSMWFLSYVASSVQGDNITFQFKVPKRTTPTITLAEIGSKLGDGTITLFSADAYAFVCNMAIGRTTTGHSRVQFSFEANAEL